MLKHFLAMLKHFPGFQMTKKLSESVLLIYQSSIVVVSLAC